MAGQRKSAAPKPRASSPAAAAMAAGKGGRKSRAPEPVARGRGGTKRKSVPAKEGSEEEASDAEEEARQKMKRSAVRAVATKTKQEIPREEEDEEVDDGEEAAEEDGDEGFDVALAFQTPAVDVKKYIRQLDDLERKNASKGEAKEAHPSMVKLQAIFAEMDEEMADDGAGEDRKRIEEVTATFEQNLTKSAEYIEQLDVALRAKAKAWHPMEEACRTYWKGEQKKLEATLGAVITSLGTRGEKIEEARSAYEAMQAALLSNGIDQISKALDSKSMAHRARRLILA